MRKKLFVLIFLCLLCNHLKSEIICSDTSGNWNNQDTWINRIIPCYNDTVVISSGDTVLINDGETYCYCLSFENNNQENSCVIVDSSSVLNVTKDIIFSNPGISGAKQEIIIEGKIFCRNIKMANTSSYTRDNILSIKNNGEVNISGDIITEGTATENIISFYGTGILKIAGSFGNRCTFNAGNGTVEFTGTTEQEIPAFEYYNLLISGNKTAQGNIFVNGNLFLYGKFILEENTLLLAPYSKIHGEFADSVMIELNSNGKLIKQGIIDSDFMMLYPVGKNNIYSPIMISNIQGQYDSVASITFMVNDEKHPAIVENNILWRYWTVETKNIIFCSSNGYFQYNDKYDIKNNDAEYNNAGRFFGTSWKINEDGVCVDTLMGRLNFTGITQLEGEWTTGKNNVFLSGTIYITIKNGRWNDTTVWAEGLIPDDVTHNVVIRHPITQYIPVLEINNLIIGTEGILNLSSRNIFVNGTTRVSGVLTDNAIPGINIFNDTIIVNPNGIFTTAKTSEYVFRGGIINNGVFDKEGEGSVTFGTNTQKIISNGSQPLKISGQVNIDVPVTLEGNNGVIFNDDIKNNSNLLIENTWLEFLGNIDNNSSFTQKTGISFFNDTTIISGTGTNIFNKVFVKNSQGLSISSESAVDIKDTLTLNAPECLIIESSDSNTDTAGSLITKGFIGGTGTAKIKKYFLGDSIKSNAKTWYFSSSVSNKKTNSLLPAHGLYQWNADATSAAWSEDISSESAEMEAMRGYAVRFISSGIQDFSGKPNTGKISIPVSSGWNLVGNPYPSTIDWDAEDGWIKENISNSVYVRTGENYAVYNGNSKIGINGGSRYIATGQGFFIHAFYSVTPKLEINDEARIHNKTNTLKKEKIQEKNMFRVKLKCDNKNDEIVIGFMPEASNGLDVFDSKKIIQNKNENFGLYTILPSGEKNVIDFYSSLNDTFFVNIGINAVEEKECYLNISDENMDNNYEAVLYDMKTEIKQNIFLNHDYMFKMQQQKEENRFKICVEYQSKGAVLNPEQRIEDDLKILFVNRDLVIEGEEKLIQDAVLSVYDITGRKILSTKILNTGPQNISLPKMSQTYIVNVKGSRINKTVKLYK